MDQLDFEINIDPDKHLRNVLVDNIIFGYHDKELKVLLHRPIPLDKWTVTGGHIKKFESIEEAADRIAYLRTGLRNLFFQQFRSFGHPTRSLFSPKDVERLNKYIGTELPQDAWIF